MLTVHDVTKIYRIHPLSLELNNMNKLNYGLTTLRAWEWVKSVFLDAHSDAEDIAILGNGLNL